VKEDTRIQVKFLFYAALLVVALVIDSVWLAYYTDPFWNSAFVDSNSLWAMRRAAVVVSYLLLLAEVIACFFAVALGANEPIITRRL
jgi:hypothetical protein